MSVTQSVSLIVTLFINHSFNQANQANQANQTNQMKYTKTVKVTQSQTKLCTGIQYFHIFPIWNLSWQSSIQDCASMEGCAFLFNVMLSMMLGTLHKWYCKVQNKHLFLCQPYLIGLWNNLLFKLFGVLGLLRDPLEIF